MNYSKMSTKEELLESLTKVDKKLQIAKSGIPLAYDENNLYIMDNDFHTLIIGSSGSGKTQSTILPTIKLAITAGESFFINETKGELYKELSGLLTQKQYNIYNINMSQKDLGNNWNPLILPYELYKNNEKDEAMNTLDEITAYLFNNSNIKTEFYIESVRTYFKGLALYLFEYAKQEEINLQSVSYLSQNLTEEKLEKIKDQFSIYTNLSSVLLAKEETKREVLSVFNQQLNYYVSREELSNILSTSDFDIKDVNNKNAYIINGDNSPYSDTLIPLFIYELTYCQEKYGTKNRLNIFIDELDVIDKINDFPRKLSIARSNNIKYYATISNLKALDEKYTEKFQFEFNSLLASFQCIIYLLSDSQDTLRTISKMCGECGIVEKNISEEELKLLKMFEAIIIKTRSLPSKTKLLPDYQIPWPEKYDSVDMPVRAIKNIKVYKGD